MYNILLPTLSFWHLISHFALHYFTTTVLSCDVYKLTSIQEKDQEFN